jgi:hypothetical protein
MIGRKGGRIVFASHVSGDKWAKSQMERRTIQTINVIRALKAFWIAQPGQVEESHALRELTRTLDAYLGGDDESSDASKTGTEHRVPQRDG